MNDTTNTDVVIYQAEDGSTQLEVQLRHENVWLTRHQMAALFGRDVKTIGKHIMNARREELSGRATVAKFATVQQEGIREVQRQVEHYDLDMVLSVGYRVKSPEGVRFRHWSNRVLKQYVVEGAAVNNRRLAQLGAVVEILRRSNEGLVGGVAEVLSQYLPSLQLLQQYDDGALLTSEGSIPKWQLTYQEARQIIDELAVQFPQNTLFGQERNDGLKGVVEAIYQGFAGQELYPTAEEKAANLLYLIIKDHPLADGNKRSAAALFVTFLSRNGLLEQSGISNSALAAITLMVAMSEPKEKDLMTALVTNMIEPSHNPDD